MHQATGAAANSGAAGSAAALVATFAPPEWGPERVALAVGVLAAVFGAAITFAADLAPALRERLKRAILGAGVFLSVLLLAGCSGWVRISGQGFEASVSAADGYTMTCYERDSEGECLETSVEVRGGTISERGAGAIGQVMETAGEWLRFLLPAGVVSEAPEGS